ncbi:FUSC family protein [Demequina sp. SYSU T00192]|uniref:FUSC family protein n=1 Tax=Demequina litoralis TaxID=3051660 RepID=A0ABT8G893_9MICO|nr:FUSC family protein [Demequina sp. SYSU T00192]MDN4475272.1 FUSC family protein [Demequina sp. SYSU T00192]
MADDARETRARGRAAGAGRAWAGGAGRAVASLGTMHPYEGRRWPVALQAAVAMATPAAVGVLVGHPSTGLLASSGAFTTLYAAHRSPAERARILPLIALVLTACAVAGVATGPSPLATAIGLVVVTAVAAAIVYGFSVGPPGPLFPLISYGLASHVSVLEDGVRHTPPGEVIGAYAAGTAFSCLVAASSLLLARNRAPVPRLRELLPGPRWDAVTTELFVRVLIVAVVGTAVSLLAVDPERAYWTVGAGLAVIGARPGRRHAAQRGLHRIVGTAAGAAVYVAVAGALTLPPLALALLLGGLQFGAQMLVVRHYALALVCITPMVLVMAGAARGEDPTMVVVMERVLDTVVGATLGAATGLVHRRRRST